MQSSEGVTFEYQNWSVGSGCGLFTGGLLASFADGFFEPYLLELASVIFAHLLLFCALARPDNYVLFCLISFPCDDLI